MKLEQKGTSNRKVHLFVQWFATPALPALLLLCCLSLSVICSVPAEGDVTGSVTSLLHQGLVKLSSGARVYGRPAVLTVVLQTGDVGAEERCKLPAAASSLALIAQLVIQHVWLHFHLTRLENRGWEWFNLQCEFLYNSSFCILQLIYYFMSHMIFFSICTCKKWNRQLLGM